MTRCLDVGERDVQGTEVALERLQGVDGVPAAVDQQVAVICADQVRVDVAEWRIAEWQRQAVDAWQ
jgi:hypothetical protein